MTLKILNFTLCIIFANINFDQFFTNKRLINLQNIFFTWKFSKSHRSKKVWPCKVAGCIPCILCSIVKIHIMFMGGSRVDSYYALVISLNNNNSQHNPHCIFSSIIQKKMLNSPKINKKFYLVVIQIIERFLFTDFFSHFFY